MKAKIFFNILAVIGILASFVVCYILYDYNQKEKISSVLVWGTSPLILFIFITSVVQLIKSRRSVKH